MKRRILSLLLAISMLLAMTVTVDADGTIKDVSGYVQNGYDYIDSTADIIKPESWTGGGSSAAYDSTTDIVTITGTGNTDGKKGHFFGLTDSSRNVNGKSYYDVVPILNGLSDNKIFRISFDFTNKASANGEMQLGFQPLQGPQGTSNGRNYIYKFNLSTGEITSTGGAKATVTAPVDTTVKVNMIMNLKTGQSRLYVGKDNYISNNNVFSNTGKNIKAAIFDVNQAVSYNYQLKNLSFTVYSADTTMDEVAAYAYATADELYTPGYGFELNGFQSSGIGTLGKVDMSCEGDNATGYTLTAKDSFSNAGNGAVGRYWLANADKTAISQKSVLYHSFDYTPGTLTNTQRFGVRGGNGYQWFMEFRADNTIAVGNYNGTWQAGETYNIGLFVDLTSYKYYWLIDGNIVSDGTVYSARTPIWQICYSMLGTNDTMTLKNVYTLVYEEDAELLAELSKIAQNVYVKISNDMVLDTATQILTCTATMVGKDGAFDVADMIYAAYDANGNLVSVDYAETYAEDDMNTTELGIFYPYGELDISGVAEGDELTIKAFIWDSVAGMTPISNIGKYTYTVPTTTVVE